MPSPSEDTDAAGHDETLVDQAGRPLGQRALQTRQRILEATVALLKEKSMRDLRVIDIARRIGSSPATFYQYFKDVEDVVLHLSRQASRRTPEVVSEMVRRGWEGQEGFDRARELMRIAIQHMDRFGPILRVRNNAADEGDERFRAVREAAIMPMIEAYSEEIRTAHAKSDAPSAPGEHEQWRIDPTVGATAIAALIERLTMYHRDLDQLGISEEDLVDTTATLIQFILTSRR